MQKPGELCHSYRKKTSQSFYGFNTAVMNGKLFYLVGASGSGKDSLLNYARQQLDGGDVLFAHRYITRPFTAGGENHIALSEAEFLRRRDAGFFALHWHSHTYYYGIGIEIDSWREQGFNVVVNGSRAYLKPALQRYPELLPIWIQVSEQVLRQRLQQRGRESEQQIQARLQRAQQYPLTELDSLVIVENNKTIERAGAKLVALLQASK